MFGGFALLIGLIGAFYWIGKLSGDAAAGRRFDNNLKESMEADKRRLKAFKDNVTDLDLERNLNKIAREIMMPEFSEYLQELHNTWHLYSDDIELLKYFDALDIERVLLANRSKIRSVDVSFGITIKTLNIPGKLPDECRAVYSNFILGIQKQLIDHGVNVPMCVYRQDGADMVELWDSGTPSRDYYMVGWMPTIPSYLRKPNPDINWDD